MRILLALAALAFGSPAYAGTELALFAAAVGGDSLSSTFGPQAELDDSAAFGAMLSFDLQPHRRFDVLVQRQGSALLIEDFERPPGAPFAELDVDYLHLGGRVLFRRDGRLVPYIAGTLGITRFGIDGEGSAIRPSIALGGGVDARIAPRLALRLDGRWYGTAVDSETALACGADGCVGFAGGAGFNQVAVFAGVVVRLRP